MIKILDTLEHWLSLAMIGFVIVMFWALVYLVVIVHGIVWAVVLIAVIYTWFFIMMGYRIRKQYLASKETKDV